MRSLTPFRSMSGQAKKIVLVVEDEPLVRWIAFEALETAGYEVVEAANAAQALEILKTRSDVGVLFTDVNMPGAMDGLALADLVHARWPHIRLVVTSGRGLDRQAPHSGMIFVYKPYSLDDVARAVDEAVHKDPSTE